MGQSLFDRDFGVPTPAAGPTEPSPWLSPPEAAAHTAPMPRFSAHSRMQRRAGCKQRRLCLLLRAGCV